MFGPWSAYIGRNGVAPPGAKREGDGRTPSGTYGFDFMFGVSPDPGVHFEFRRITGPNIVWDDDPSSANYNEWIDTNTQSAGASPEPMDNVPSYYYGAVIGYNDARTPGLGERDLLARLPRQLRPPVAFALPVDELLSLLRWLEPARVAAHRHRHPRRARNPEAPCLSRTRGQRTEDRHPGFTGS